MNTDEKILKALETIQVDIKEIKQGQEKLEQRQLNLEQGQQKFEQRLERLEQKVDANKKEVLEAITKNVEDLTEAIHETWKYLDQHTADIKAEIHSERLNHIEERLTKLEQQQFHTRT